MEQVLIFLTSDEPTGIALDGDGDISTPLDTETGDVIGECYLAPSRGGRAEYTYSPRYALVLTRREAEKLLARGFWASSDPGIVPIHDALEAGPLPTPSQRARRFANVATDHQVPADHAFWAEADPATQARLQANLDQALTWSQRKSL